MNLLSFTYTFDVYFRNFFFCLAALILLQSCAWRPKTEEYSQFYSHLDEMASPPAALKESDFFMVLLVDARHLDYSNSQSFLKTITKHPSNGCKDCSVGHAWIYLQGTDEKGRKIVIEGGHSGELGVVKPTYFNGMMELVQNGDENPVRYLWENLGDGFFQEGAGGHPVSFAARIPLNRSQFRNIRHFIDPRNYSYKDYSLTGRQCCSLLAQVAALVDLEMDIEITMKIEQEARVAGQKIKVWNDETFSQITFPSPDALERCLIQLVNRGEAEDATEWYRNYCRKKDGGETYKKIIETVGCFPFRYLRHTSTAW